MRRNKRVVAATIASIKHFSKLAEALSPINLHALTSTPKLELRGRN